MNMRVKPIRDFSSQVRMLLAVPLGLGAAFLTACASKVDEKEAVCVQTGPTSFQIVDIKKPDQPIVIRNIQGKYANDGGSLDRSKVIAYLDVVPFRGDVEYSEAMMDTKEGVCKTSTYARSVEPHPWQYSYKLANKL